MLIRPMLAVSGELPIASQEAAWAAEFKWDGVRAVAYLLDGEVRLLSRNDREVTGAYPELRADLASDKNMVLDGEIVALDSSGAPDFGRLQSRMHVRAPSRSLVAAVPVVYHVFDVLHLEGRSTLRLPYEKRRKLLEDLRLERGRVRVPPSFPGSARVVLDVAREHGLEGIVCKRLDAPYLPGRRSELWIKVKLTLMLDVVVGGWKPGEGRRSGTIGSLLVGVPGDEGLRYVGHVGTGFTERMLHELLVRLTPLVRPVSPFAGPAPEPAHWVEPVLRGEVEYAGWTRDGVLRHPTWRGLTT
ncbi:non-homologous end-joining DNA ligase [Nonomuraea typhae]|uniref:non-homologous end-joining DNA ligase n=1 Tax=Nonomuraea typhae TaxID=2603600 RepID=UPI001FE5BBEF|nr:non-homologous end-joining DNA ligase [Nonomuraea typhae]